MQMITHGEANLILQLWIKVHCIWKIVECVPSNLSAGWVFHMPCIHLWWHQSFQNFEKLLKLVSNTDAMVQWSVQFGYTDGVDGLFIRSENAWSNATLRLKPPRSDVHFISSLLGKQVSKESLRCFVGRTDTDPYPNALCIFANVLHRSCVILLIGLAWCSMKTSKLGLGVIMVKMWKWLAWKAGKNAAIFCDLKLWFSKAMMRPSRCFSNKAWWDESRWPGDLEISKFEKTSLTECFSNLFPYNDTWKRFDVLGKFALLDCFFSGNQGWHSFGNWAVMLSLRLARSPCWSSSSGWSDGGRSVQWGSAVLMTFIKEYGCFQK